MLTNRFLRFGLLFVLIYFGTHLIVKVSPISQVYNSVYCEFQEWVMNTWHPYMHTDLSTEVDIQGVVKQDIALYGYNKSAFKRNRKEILRGLKTDKLEPGKILAFEAASIWNAPLFLLWALMLATPATRKKKLISFFLGSYLFAVFMAMKLTYAAELANGENINTLWHCIASVLGTNQTYQEIYLLIILLIWMVVSVDRSTFSPKTA